MIISFSALEQATGLLDSDLLLFGVPNGNTKKNGGNKTITWANFKSELEAELDEVIGDLTVTNSLLVDTISEYTSNSGVTVDGLLVKDGGIAPSGTSSRGGVLYTGTITDSGAGTPRTLNTLVGTVTFTGIGDIAADGTTNLVINNSLVTASTVGMVVLQTTTAAAGSTPRIETVTYGSGTITIAVRNSDPATGTGAGATFQFSFQLFKL